MAQMTNKRLYTEMGQLEELYEGSNLRRERNINYVTLSRPKKDGLPTTIEIEISNNYPFKSPNIYSLIEPENKTQYIHTIHYCHMPRIAKHIIAYRQLNHQPQCIVSLKNQNQNHNHRNILEDECFHCTFITNDWSPAMRLIHIVYEIQRINYIKRNIKYRISLERIKCIPEELIPFIISFIDPR